MWEAICLTVAATAGNNIGKVLQKKDCDTSICFQQSLDYWNPDGYFRSHLDVASIISCS
ncbi:hypothetical protein CASFOL_001339 [Castilleja foliolosa]|uniref:Uncharacterized protein n=1 Tax=Castilleja foliolosa TaxID=1961234 RepID=A0ABD3EM91_9LAMI